MNLKPTEARVKQAWRRVPRVGAVDVLRTGLLIDVSAGAKKSRLPRFMDVLRTYLAPLQKP
jgi:hypothetical protein